MVGTETVGAVNSWGPPLVLVFSLLESGPLRLGIEGLEAGLQNPRFSPVQEIVTASSLSTEAGETERVSKRGLGGVLSLNIKV